MEGEKKYKSDVGVFAIGMTKKEIKTLVFWAAIGIAKSRGGTYEKVAPKMVQYFAEKMKVKLPVKPVFKR